MNVSLVFIAMKTFPWCLCVLCYVMICYLYCICSYEDLTVVSMCVMLCYVMLSVLYL